MRSALVSVARPILYFKILSATWTSVVVVVAAAAGILSGAGNSSNSAQ